MGKKGRKPGFFNGVVKDGKGYSSASIEVYVPIEETKTEGVMVLDGSLGYIGKAEEPTRILFRDGRITEIEKTPTGLRLTRDLVWKATRTAGSILRENLASD